MGIFDFLFRPKEKKPVKYKVFESVLHAESVITINKAVLVEAGNTKICFTRTKTGFYAIENKCSHEFKPLNGGTCTENDEIICPFHRHIIDLKTGANKSHAGCGKTNIYKVEINEKGIYVWV